MRRACNQALNIWQNYKTNVLIMLKLRYITVGGNNSETQVSILGTY